MTVPDWQSDSASPSVIPDGTRDRVQTSTPGGPELNGFDFSEGTDAQTGRFPFAPLEKPGDGTAQSDPLCLFLRNVPMDSASVPPPYAAECTGNRGRRYEAAGVASLFAGSVVAW